MAASDGNLPKLAAAEIAAAWPVHADLQAYAPLDDEARAAFIEDTRLNGIFVPVEVSADGVLIDGRERVSTAAILGISVPYIVLPAGADLKARIESLNTHRRHLDKVELAFLAARDVIEGLAAEAADRRGRHDVNESEAGTAIEIAARNRGVSGGYAKNALAILKSADVDLEERAKRKVNRTPLSTCAGIARKESPDERNALKGALDDTNTRLTDPAFIVDFLRIVPGGVIHLDAASDPGKHVAAREHYIHENGDNGLRLSWTVDRNGERILIIWINPPYDKPLPWVKRAIKTVAAHPELGIWVLLPTRVIGTKAGALANRHASNYLLFDERMRFYVGGGHAMPGSLPDGSVLYAFGSASCIGLEKWGAVCWPDPESRASVRRAETLAATDDNADEEAA